MTRCNVAKAAMVVAVRAFPLLVLVSAGCGYSTPVGPTAQLEVTRTDHARALPPDMQNLAIPPEYFGLHLLTIGAAGTVWPTVPFGLYRLIDATPRWHALSPSRHEWADDPTKGSGMSRIEHVLQMRDRYAPGLPVLYTLAGGGASGKGDGFPKWLHAARADTLAEWRRFVREVGTRFDGRIQYWEIWNEPDCSCFYKGTPKRLAELTRIAAEELRAINPHNIIVAPAFTQHGLKWMNAFFEVGGGKHVDIIAWHQDNHSIPEQDTTLIKTVRRIMHEHGLQHLPLWTTEGHARSEPGGDDAAILARTYLVLWAFGVRSFSWYAWDVYDYGTAFPGPWVTLVEPGRRDTPTPAGQAYGEIARWLTGTRMTNLDINGENWRVHLLKPSGQRAQIVWSTAARPQPVAIPVWVTRMRTLDGTERFWSGETFVPGKRPVFFW